MKQPGDRLILRPSSGSALGMEKASTARKIKTTYESKHSNNVSSNDETAFYFTHEKLQLPMYKYLSIAKWGDPIKGVAN